MDIKRQILVLSLIGVLVIGWQMWVSYELKLHPNWGDQSKAQPSVTAAPGAEPVPSTNPTTMATGASAATTSTGPVAVGSPLAMPARIGNDATNAADYHMQLAIEPRGGGLSAVTLNEFFQTAEHKVHYVCEEPLAGLEDQTSPLATRSITINGTEIDVSTINWTQASVSQSSAIYTAVIQAGGRPILQVTKTFQVLPASSADKKQGQGYDIVFNQSFRNLSDKALKVSEIFNGPNPPSRENDRSEDRRYVSGRDQGDKFVDVASTFVYELKKDKAPKDLATTDSYPMLWLGACSSYFDAIYRPDYVASPNPPDVKIASAMTAALDAGPLAPADEVPTSLQISTSDFTIQPGHEVPFNAHVFFGPKMRQLLEDPYYAGFPLAYNKTLVYVSQWCGFLTFSWLINILYWILTCFHWMLRDWGLSIIGLVCLVRLMLHPITRRSQISMMQMAKKGPEIERLKKKYADDKESLNKAMMEVMNPGQQLLGCAPMFLQTPIWIALWSALQSTFELRQAGFLRWSHLHMTWIADLSKPDALYTLPAPLPLYFFTLHSINVLPVLVGVVAFIQQQMMPVPENMTPEQEQQRKMQKWMLLLFPIMLYVGPSGLTLYILTSSTIGMIENKIIRDHIKQQEEAAKTQIIVDAPPNSQGKRNKGRDQKKAAVKPTGIAGWIAELAAKAEEVRRDAERRSKNKA